jgi:hypothetical protein
MRTVGPIAGVKRQKREAEPSFPSTAEVKTGGPMPPIPIYLHGRVLNYIIKYRDNLTLTSRHLLTKKMELSTPQQQLRSSVHELLSAVSSAKEFR